MLGARFRSGWLDAWHATATIWNGRAAMAFKAGQAPLKLQAAQLIWSHGSSSARLCDSADFLTLFISQVFYPCLGQTSPTTCRRTRTKGSPSAHFPQRDSPWLCADTSCFSLLCWLRGHWSDPIILCLRTWHIITYALWHLSALLPPLLYTAATFCRHSGAGNALRGLACGQNRVAPPIHMHEL